MVKINVNFLVVSKWGS